MIITEELRKSLTPLVHADVEKALNILLDHILKEKEEIFDNPNATDAELRQFQGQKKLISELKQYRGRLSDSILREKERREDVILNKS